MISSMLSFTATRVAVTGYISVSLFKRTVVRHTVQRLSKAETIQAYLRVASTTCSLTVALVLACHEATQEILDSLNDSNTSAGNLDSDTATADIHTTPDTIDCLASCSHQEPLHEDSKEDPMEPLDLASPLQQYYVPIFQPTDSSPVIKSREPTFDTPITSSTPSTHLDLFKFDSKRLSINSDTILVAHNDDSIHSQHIFHDASDFKDLKPPADDGTLYEHAPRNRSQYALIPHTINTNTPSTSYSRARKRPVPTIIVLLVRRSFDHSF
ncbi:uncharacterized protein EDB91DRAFT_662111 [Suillus paluster]|uniref:uncharacterized protein n=1 Tax=Suillus paluster TaxID=48578 RepID=UPI001B87952A|nr:uncharacterized protein EDB91DRAFT_662111 [Suillus paluster]KAG1732911.1 hypothetical protein EDB91DRAFT_662111 [Suillus paluster]